MALPGSELELSGTPLEVAAVSWTAAGGGTLFAVAAVVIRLNAALMAVARDVAVVAGAVDGLALAFDALATLSEGAG